MSLDRSTFLELAATKFPLEEVHLPTLGEGASVFVRTMSAGERDRFEEKHLKLKHRDYRARIIVACACDSFRNPLFDDTDTEKISALPANVVDTIVEAASRLNGVGGETREEAAKNSEAGQD